MLKGRAYVFINYDQALGFGHIGWGFQIGENDFYYGSTDHLWDRRHPFWDPVELVKYMDVKSERNNDFWSGRGTEEQMLKTMRTGRHVRYHAYKIVSVENVDLNAAHAFAANMKNDGWNVIFNNCVHQSYNILTTYGGKDILPDPNYLRNRLPHIWFDSIDAEAIILEKSTGRNLLPFFPSPSNRRVG